MSSIERFSRTIPASGVIENGRGNVLLVISATGTINVRLENGGAAEGVSGVNGGVRIERTRPWDNARILGAAGVTVEFWIGSQNVERDLIDVFTQIATIAGVAAVAVEPSVAVNTPADGLIPGGGGAPIAANLLRRSIRIGSRSTNAPATTNLRVLSGVGPAAGVELQPGTWEKFDTTAALNVVNADANPQTYWIFEES